MKGKIFIAVLGISLLAASCNAKPTSYNDGTVRLAGTTVAVDVANTDESRDLGLGGRANLTNQQGMWFVFDTPQRYGFWMKGMLFPIDIIWIRDNQVIQISSNVPTEPGVSDNDLTTYAPSQPVDRVLELRAGWADHHGLTQGDQLQFLPNP